MLKAFVKPAKPEAEALEQERKAAQEKQIGRASCRVRV